MFQRRCFLRMTAAAAANSASSDPSAAASTPLTSSSSSAAPPSHDQAAFTFKPRLRYSPLFTSSTLEDFLMVRDDTHVVTIATTFQHPVSGVRVTLIPLAHFAHPQFFHQVDSLCCQHESVLMEGRVPLTGSPHSTTVPPRELADSVRPVDCLDDEGWEPREVDRYWQPFSWGVKGSPMHTVVHAADAYDYEKLPWWASLRFNMPFFGSYRREKHCLNMIPALSANGYRSFAVPWGAYHMPIFQQMLEDNGFEQVGLSSLLLWSKIDGDVSTREWHRLNRLLNRRQRWKAYTVVGLGLFVGRWVLANSFSMSVGDTS